MLEETQTFDDGSLVMTPSKRDMIIPSAGSTHTPWSNAPIEWNTQRIGAINRRLRSFSTATGPAALAYQQANMMNWRNWGEPMQLAPSQHHFPLAPVTNLAVRTFNHSKLIRYNSNRSWFWSQLVLKLELTFYFEQKQICEKGVKVADEKLMIYLFIYW